MDSSSIISIIVLIILVILSAFFSATETAFSVLNRVRVKHMADSGSSRAAFVLKLSNDYDRVLSTILVGNNIVNITATSVATVLFVKYFANMGATISTIVMTITILIFGEISPKSLAKESPEKFAIFAAPILGVFMQILRPINYIFSQWKNFLSKIFKFDENQAITEEELLIIVGEAEQEGAINEEDKQLIHSVIEFNDLKASEILTPRVDLSAVSITASNEEITQVFLETGYSRIPVFEGSLDDIIGIIHLRDFFDSVINKKGKIDEIISSIVHVMPSTKISNLLKLLQQEKSHIAVVTDEYGGTLGIVTMEDILEELVGEIWDEHDEIVEQFIDLGEGKYKVICSADIDKVLSHFGLADDIDSISVSGWIMEQLEKIPEEGDAFDYENIHVVVTKTDNRRALECMITVRPEETDMQANGAEYSE